MTTAITLSDILEQQRQLYLDEFTRRSAGFSQNTAAVMQLEALFRRGAEAPIRTGSLDLPARGDLCVKRDNRIVEIARIESPRLLAFAPFRFVWGNTLQVALHPFAWGECQICVPEPMQAIRPRALADWLETEIKLDLACAKPGALLQVVHGMSEPREANDGVRFEVDFGSAPVTAFEGLLSALADAGAGLAVVGQSALGAGH